MSYDLRSHSSASPAANMEAHTKQGHKPVLSIITVHRNDFEGLRRTLASVHALRDATEIEWIVVDGLSSWVDFSLRSEVKLKADKFISESDGGIYDAMNKGYCLASGEFVSFMNAGDVFTPDAASMLGAFFASSAHVDLAVFGSFEGAEGELARYKSPRGLKWIWYGMPGHHQAMLFRASVLPARPYDLSYRVAADYDLVSRLHADGVFALTVDRGLCVFELGGLSTVERELGLSEQQIVRAVVLRVPCALNWLIKQVKRVVLNARSVVPGCYAWFRYASTVSPRRR